MGCDWLNAGSDEIDFVEVLSNDHTHINQQIHSGSNNAGCSAPVSDASQNWHTYKMVWKKDSLVWYIDGVKTCEQTAQIPSTPMFVIVNTAMTGTVDTKTMPQQMLVDYITLTQP
jgi:beta-glucanase (GH16 family)